MFGYWVLLFIFGLIVISSFAGLLPVVSCVLIDKWLIINAIHFSGQHALSCCYGAELELLDFQDWGCSGVGVYCSYSVSFSFL